MKKILFILVLLPLLGLSQTAAPDTITRLSKAQVIKTNAHFLSFVSSGAGGLKLMGTGSVLPSDISYVLVKKSDSTIGQISPSAFTGEYVINTTTTDATPIGTTLTILGPSGQSTHLDCTFTAVLDDGNGGYTAKKTRGFLKNAGGTVSAGTQVSVNADEYYGSGLSTATSALGTVSGNPGYTITGESGKTILWTIRIKVTLSAAAL